MGFLSKKSPAAWHDVCAAGDFTHSLEVKVDGKSYAIFRQSGKLYCTQGSCSHEYSALCDGMLQDGEILCEKHGSRFRLSDGAILSPPASENIKVYEIRDTDGRIEILV